MFGLNDDTQKSNDDPAMLDNVKDLASQPASAVEPPQQNQTSPSQVTTDSATPVTAQSTSPQSPAGFNMPTDDTSGPHDQSQATDDSSDDERDSSLDENIGHIEPVEGFSSSPLPADDPQVGDANQNSDQPLPDNTIPQTEDNQSDSEQTESSPQISQHATPSLRNANSKPAEPSQNDLTAPPAPVVSDSPEQVTSQPDENSASGDSQNQEPVSAESTEISAVNHEELESIKKEALGHLEGLTDHIGGSPEEVFRSTMQLIQANDNHTLLQKALEAAKKIEDDKVRAQAMLDIVNETNYFSENS